MSIISETIKQLEARRASAQKEFAGLDEAIKALGQLGGKSAPAAKIIAVKPARKGGMSAAGRARIVAAQKARWAKVKSGETAAKPVTKKTPVKPVAKVAVKPAKKNAKMSAEGRARIVAAQKARWAKINAAKAASAA